MSISSFVWQQQTDGLETCPYFPLSNVTTDKQTWVAYDEYYMSFTNKQTCTSVLCLSPFNNRRNAGLVGHPDKHDTISLQMSHRQTYISYNITYILSGWWRYKHKSYLYFSSTFPFVYKWHKSTWHLLTTEDTHTVASRKLGQLQELWLLLHKVRRTTAHFTFFVMNVCKSIVDHHRLNLGRWLLTANSRNTQVVSRSFLWKQVRRTTVHLSRSSLVGSDN